MAEQKTDTGYSSCVDCLNAPCREGEGAFPLFCPNQTLAEAELAEALEACRLDPMDQAVALAACETEEAAFCGSMTRVEETMEFARRIGAKKIGIASCVGLLSESHTLARILRVNGFEVYGICCKVGSLSKLETGLSPEQLAKFRNGPIMCNPIGQALLLNRAGTQLNILMGLCVGHDTLFYRFCEGYCTTLVTKDRILAHNPAGALYETGSFYRRLLPPEEKQRS